MPAKAGDRLPDVALSELVDGRPSTVQLTQLFAGKKGILFGVPGAFTPGCSKTHLPGYVADFDTLREAGAEVIACVSVNDPFVMGAWGKEQGAAGKVRMLADPRGELAGALGTLFDARDVLGTERTRRFSAVVDDNVISSFNLEKQGEMSCSLASQIVEQLKQEERQPEEPPGMFDVMRRHWGF